MKPIKVTHLSFAYIGFVALLILGLGAYTWIELERRAEQIRQEETTQARQEIADALEAIRAKLQSSAKTLAEWDETKQQLVYNEFYPLWRDERVKNSGLMPNSLASVALYDLKGRILSNNATGHMPESLPVSAPAGIILKENSRDWLYYFFPIYNDPGHERLLGYGGLKFDFLVEMALIRQFRYADLSRLRTDLPDHSPFNFKEILPRLRFGTQANEGLSTLHGLLRDVQLQMAILFMAGLATATWLLSRFVVAPLRRLSADIDTLRESGAKATNGHASNAPLLVWELENVRRSFGEYHARLSDMRSDLERSSRDFYDQARHDALTGAYNRRAYDEDRQALVENHHPDQKALILFDCDHFKAINDTYGHQVGDNVIKAIAHCLQGALRDQDRLYRLGGDEFATLLPDMDENSTMAIAERCLEHVMVHDFHQHGVGEPVSISIGLAHGEEEVSLADLQKRADLAMYAAKRPGYRKIVVYEDKLGDVSALLANDKITAVYQAIQDPFLIEFRYQPVKSLPDLETAYVEALARINNHGEVIRPLDIFPVVQARRLDAEFDQAVIQAVQRDIEFKRIPEGLGVSINLSVPGLLNAKVVDMMIALKLAYPGSKILVEITETAFIEHMDVATEQIHRLREVGCVIALDDFGSGYSSLRYLASMPVDIVKFDISMVRLLHAGDARQQQMIQDIAKMVASVGYGMVAEGIENKELLDKVLSLGFSHAQGYYFDPPA